MFPGLTEHLRKKVNLWLYATYIFKGCHSNVKTMVVISQKVPKSLFTTGLLAYPFTLCTGTVPILGSNTVLSELITPEKGGKIEKGLHCSKKKKKKRPSKKKTRSHQSTGSRQPSTRLLLTGSKCDIAQVSTDPSPFPLRMQRARVIPHVLQQASAGTVAMDQQTPDNLLPSSKFSMCSNPQSPSGLKGALQSFGVCQAFSLALGCCLTLCNASFIVLFFFFKNRVRIAVPAYY